MRESEFCIPSSNRAVISITNNWYDRRALDTRSNFALYHSLLHLQNLCQTSPKVRESLVCDGGVEQLVRILKEGKLRQIPDAYQLRKWQQALLCLANIGVRGSESVRNRLVEADVVPVILTILCNALDNMLSHRSSCPHGKRGTLDRDGMLNNNNDTRVTAAIPLAMMPDPTSMRAAEAFLAGYESTANDVQTSTVSAPQQISASIASTAPVRVRRRVSAESSESPAAPMRPATEPIGPSRRMMRTYVDSDANDSDEAMSLSDSMNIENEARIQDLSLGTSEENDVNSLENLPEAPAISLAPSSTHESRNPHDIGADTSTLRDRQLQHERVVQQVMNRQSERHVRPPASWDQDVTICLRLLAYLSKYAYMRLYFSRSYDVPRLRQNLKQYEMYCKSKEAAAQHEQMSDDLSDSLRIPCNIFQVVENFTMRIHAHDSTYWAGVIMRNSCRRDEQNGGIRQCAYLECGIWETQNRQFAKCRRCRRTKYCSKACQSKAWTGHRYWCSTTQSPEQNAEPRE